jgi:hypothetical protein
MLLLCAADPVMSEVSQEGSAVATAADETPPAVGPPGSTIVSSVRAQEY